MRRRKARRRVEIDSALYSGWLHRGSPASLTELFTRSRRRNRVSEKREKREKRRARRSNGK